MRGTHRLAWIPILCAACGGGTSSDQPDASSGPPDSAVTPDANLRSTVHVHVLDPQGTDTPVVGEPVVFLDPDGTLVARVATDGSGDAAADVLPGASATAVSAFNGGFAMRTVLGLDAGRTVTIGGNLNFPITQTVNISFPANPNASFYRMAAPCGDVGATGNSIQITSNDLCKETTATLVITAFDSGAQPIGYLLEPGVTLTDGASINLGGMWQFGLDVQGSITGLPNDATSVTYERCVPDILGHCASATVTPAAGGAGASVHGAPSDTADMLTLAYRSGGAVQWIGQRVSGSVTSYGLDVGSTVGAWLGDPTLDLATYQVHVPFTGAGPIDGAHVNVAYHRPSDNIDLYWSIEMPTLADFALPTMPAEVGDVMPHAGDTSYIDGIATVHVAGSSGWSSYLDRMPAPMEMGGPLRAGAGTVVWSVSSGGQIY